MEKFGMLISNFAVQINRHASFYRSTRDFPYFRNDTEMERGVGKNVLGGPLSALRHFVRGMTAYPGYALKAGDIVTTGTLTRALSIAQGERWNTRLEGIPLPGMDLALTA